MKASAPRSIDDIAKEVTAHIRDIVADGKAGDPAARQWFESLLREHFATYDFWAEHFLAPLSVEQRLDAHQARLKSLLAAIGNEQGAIRQIQETLQTQGRAPMAAEIIASRQKWEFEQMQAHNRHAADRHAAEQAAAQRAAAEAAARAAHVAAEHKQRAERDKANMDAKRRELYQQGFMPN